MYDKQIQRLVKAEDKITLGYNTAYFFQAIDFFIKINELEQKQIMLFDRKFILLFPMTLYYCCYK